MGASSFFGRAHDELIRIWPKSQPRRSWVTPGRRMLLSCNTPCDVNGNNLCIGEGKKKMKNSTGMMGGSEEMLDEPVRSKRREKLSSGFGNNCMDPVRIKAAGVDPERLTVSLALPFFFLPITAICMFFLHSCSPFLKHTRSFWIDLLFLLAEASVTV